MPDDNSHTRGRPSGPIRAGITVLGALLIGADSGARADSSPPSVFHLGDGTVIDGEKRRAYVMEPDGAVVALDLSTGRPVWKAPVSGKPLALDGNALIVQAESVGQPGHDLSIAALNTERQGALMAQKHVELPADVRVAIAHTRSQLFTAEATLADHNVIIQWQFVKRPRTGVYHLPKNPSTEPAATSQVPGALVRQDTVLMNMFDPAVSPQVLARVPGPEAFSLSVTPEALTPIIPDAPKPQFLSWDSRHVMHPDLVSDDREWNKYRWTLFDRSTAKPIGTVPMHVRVAPFMVLDNQTLIVNLGPYQVATSKGYDDESLQMRAINITSGKTVWSQQLRDPNPKGPSPP